MDRPAPIDLSIGDPGYPPPREVQVAAVQAIARGLGGYAPMGGLRRLRAGLAERLTAREGIPATPDQVVVTTGASLGIFAALSTLCRAGDVVLVPDPGFPPYRLAAASLGLRVAEYRLLGPRGEPDWEALNRLAPTARLLVWNYPSNPLGTLVDRAWFDPLFALLERCPGMVLLSDEVYGDLCLGDEPPVPAASMAGGLGERVVSVFSFSKSFGMAAWRVGYLHARARWAEQISRAHWGATMSTATASQLGALAALRVSEGYLAEQRAFLRTNRDLAVSRLCGCGLACPSPPAGFFAWADIEPYGLDSDEFADRCAAEAGVLISAGSAFGSSGRRRVRINFAVPGDRLAAALDRLSAWVGARLAPAAAR